MKQPACVVVYFLLILALVACSASVTTSPAAANPSLTATATQPSPAATSSPAQPIKTNTAALTSAPIPTLTESVILVPTDTRSIIFDTAAIQTATPAPAAKCPPEFSGIVPTPGFVDTEEGIHLIVQGEDVLDFLNHYGAEALQTEYQKTSGKNWTGSIQVYRDLTNDGVSELVLGWGNFFIFGCQNGHYTKLFQMVSDSYMQSAKIVKVLDANRNGIPDILLLTGFLSQGGHFYQVIEWDGQQFQNLLVPRIHGIYSSLFVEASGDLGYEDIDHDGLIEYIAEIGIPVFETYQFGIPWRQEKQIYKWNGKQFTFQKSIFSAPEYRFQAVQDGDRAAREGDYDTALDLYQQAIFNDHLEWWSPERREFVKRVFFGRWDQAPTPTPPLPNPEEYDYLAAYARYRIMLLHLSRGWQSDANVVYDTLQKKYPDGKPGHIYAALAEHVWSEFSQSQDLKKACDQAIAFTVQNQEAIYYFIEGSVGDNGLPGNDSINYEADPLWICPYQ